MNAPTQGPAGNRRTFKVHIPASAAYLYERFDPSAVQSAKGRFIDKIDFNGSIPAHDPNLGPCWVWLGGQRNKEHNYGGFWAFGRGWLAHRFSYQLWRGLIPGDLVVDHVCANPYCVAPHHLQVTDRSTNSKYSDGSGKLPLDRSHCPAGHEYTEANTYRGPAPNTYRRCKTCRSEQETRRTEARKAARAAGKETSLPTAA